MTKEDLEAVFDRVRAWPRVFGMVLTMMQRYLVLILRKAEDLHLALRKQKRTNQSLGEILVEMKSIARDVLDEELKRL